MILVTYSYVPSCFKESLQRAVDSLGTRARMQNAIVYLETLEDFQELQRLVGHTISLIHKVI